MTTDAALASVCSKPESAKPKTPAVWSSPMTSAVRHDARAQQTPRDRREIATSHEPRAARPTPRTAAEEASAYRS